MAFVEDTLLLFIDYQILVTLIGTIIAGDNVVLFLSFLAGQGAVNLYVVFIFSLAGTIFSDLIWLWLFRFSYFKPALKNKHISKISKDLTKALNKLAKGNHFIVLLIAKFLYGTRIITIAYLSKEKIKTIIFLIYDTIITSIWLIVLISLGWSVGKGLNNYIDIFQDFQKGLGFALGFVALTYIIRLLIDKFIVKTNEKKKR